MSEPCKFPTFDSCQKMFLWTHKEADFAPHPVIGLVLRVGDTERCSHTLGARLYITKAAFAGSVAVYFAINKRPSCDFDLFEHIPVI